MAKTFLHAVIKVFNFLPFCCFFFFLKNTLSLILRFSKSSHSPRFGSKDICIDLFCMVARQLFPREVSDLKMKSCGSEVSAWLVEGDSRSENLRFLAVVVILAWVL